MSNFNILALDCATKTGWATLIYGHIESGVQDFTKRRGESNGILFMRFNAWLNTMLHINPTGNINLVVFEKAHHRGGAATEIGVGLTTRAEEFASWIGAEYMGIHSTSIKKYITGHGKASKDDMIMYFWKMTGRKPVDDNEADAYCLLQYAMNEFNISPAPK